MDTDSKVRIAVFDMLGKEVAILDESYQNAGIHTNSWKAERYPEGSYVLKLFVEDGSYMKKIFLVR